MKLTNYPRRGRYYDKATKQYATIDDMIIALRAGEKLQVITYPLGKDVTTETLVRCASRSINQAHPNYLLAIINQNPIKET